MLPEVLGYLSANADRFVEELEDFLRIPSVSGDSRHTADVRRGAEFVEEQLAAAGVAAEIVETDGHPIVYGTWTKDGNAPTVLVYGHYDVQPPDPPGRVGHTTVRARYPRRTHLCPRSNRR